MEHIARDSEKMEAVVMEAEECCSVGNDLYREGQLEAALEKYGEAICILPLPKYYSNRAAVLLQLHKYKEAEDDCRKAILLDPLHSHKATVRLGLALEALGQFVEALQVFKRAMLMGLPPALYRVASAGASRLAAFIVADEKAMEAEGVPDGLWHDKQILRLQLLSPLPPAISTGVFFDAAVAAGNEFGLWAHDFPLSFTVDYVNWSATSTNDEGSMKDNRLMKRLHVEIENGQSNAESVGGRGRFKVRFVWNPGDDADGTEVESSLLLMLRISAQSPDQHRTVVPVISLPITLYIDNVNNNISSCDAGEISNCALVSKWEGTKKSAEIGAFGCRQALVSCLDRYIYIAESPGQIGLSGKVWDAGFVLTEYLSAPDKKHIVAGKTVLELGAGTGIVSICCALLGASHIYCTDFPSVCPLIDVNIMLNGVQAHAQAYPLVWGEQDLHAELLDCDVVLMSDVVYDPVGYEPLVVTLEQITDARPSAYVMMAHRHRHPDDKIFFETLDRSFTVTDLLEQHHSEQEKGVSNDELSNGQASAAADVRIMRLTRRPGS